jgi:hypothetical protein
MAVQILPQLVRLFLNDANATPAGGGSVTFYRAGTNDLAPIFSDPAYTVPLENPVVADASGQIVPVYTNVTYAVKAIIKSALGTTLATIDPVVRTITESTTAASITFSPITGNTATTVQQAIANVTTANTTTSTETRLVSRGGTGATTAAGARTNLGIGPQGVKPLRILETADANDLSDGTYEYVSGSSSPSNVSTVVTTGLLTQFTRDDGTRVYQRATGVNDSGVQAVAGRDKVSGVWGAWYSSLLTVEA